MMYEIRLGGGKVFHIGFLTGILGRLTIMKAPDFARAADFPDYAREGGGKGVWNLKAIDEHALATDFANSGPRCRPLALTERTPGVGFIVLNSGDRSVHVDVYLSTREFAANGLSVHEDWTQIVQEAKDDPHRDVLLAMNFGAVTADEIEGFKSGKALTTTDVDLHVRPRAHPFARDERSELL
jgi:hypothetical protein